MRVQNANTAAPSGEPQFTGWCIDAVDLCVAKLCAFREKDRNFVAALIDAGLVDSHEVAQRLPAVDQHQLAQANAALGWLESRAPD